MKPDMKPDMEPGQEPVGCSGYEKGKPWLVWLLFEAGKYCFK
jgi:hypothetical protein